MSRFTFHHKSSVIIMTLAVTLLTSSCSFIGTQLSEGLTEKCNSRAYLQYIVKDYISTRYHSNSPVRLAIFPFSAPAKIAYRNNELPGLGYEMAWKVHSEMLRSGLIPISEVVNRQDWPRKKEEFFTGNHGALMRARHAGYDLMMVGYIPEFTDLESMSAYSKLIDVESGTTLWYGKNDVRTNRNIVREKLAHAGILKRRPDLIHTDKMSTRLAQCIVDDINADRITPQ